MRVWHPWRGLERLPRVAWTLAGVTFTNRAGTMVLPFLVLYLTEGVGLSADRAGVVLVVYGVAAIVAAPVAGWLSDKIGPLRLMKVSLLLSGAVLLTVPLAHSIVGISALVFVWSLVSEAFRPASLAVTSDVVSADDRKAAFALNRLAINLGMSVGPVLGGFLATFSFVFLFVVDGATSLVAGLALAAALRMPRLPSVERPEDAAPGGSRWGALADRRMQIFVSASFLTAVVFFQEISSMPLYIVRDLGYSEPALGLLFSINTAMIVLLEVPLNLAMADWPHRRTMFVGALLVGAGFGALALASNVWWIATTVAVWTVGEMILFPGMAAFVADIAPPERRGAYMGLYMFAWSVAFAVGPWLGTVALEHAGARPLWAGCFVCGALSAAVFWLVDRGQPEGPRTLS